MPSPGGMFNERFNPSARAARKAQDMARDVSRWSASCTKPCSALSRTLWDEPRADAVQAKLDAHLDEHRDLLEDHPKWSDHYQEKDKEGGLTMEQFEPPSCWDMETASDMPSLTDSTVFDQDARENKELEAAWTAADLEEAENDRLRDAEERGDQWDEAVGDAHMKLEAHLDEHRDVLEDHPKWRGWYDTKDHDRALEEEQAMFREMVAELKERMTLENAQQVVNEGRGDQEHMRGCGEDASLCDTCSGYERESMGDVELRNVSLTAAHELVEESKEIPVAEKSRFIRPPERDRGYDLGR